jgi:DUF1680 family protein
MTAAGDVRSSDELRWEQLHEATTQHRRQHACTAALYAPSDVHTNLGGLDVHIREETDHPFRNTIRFTVTPAKPAIFHLDLRIPQWAPSAAVVVNGRKENIETRPGTFARMERQ